MSRIKMLLDVVRDLHSLTDSLETLAHAMEGKDEEQTEIGAAPEQSTPEQPATEQPATEQTTTEQSTQEQPAKPVTEAPERPGQPTLVELRAFVAERSTPQNRPRICALLAKHGVAKLTKLPESAYLDLMREVEAL